MTLSVVPLVHPKLSSNTEDDPSLRRHLSDETVTSHIYTKHREDDKAVKIDVENYIALVENIITTADRITHTVTQVYSLLIISLLF